MMLKIDIVWLRKNNVYEKNISDKKYFGQKIFLTAWSFYDSVIIQQMLLKRKC